MNYIVWNADRAIAANEGIPLRARAAAALAERLEDDTGEHYVLTPAPAHVRRPPAHA